MLVSGQVSREHIELQEDLHVLLLAKVQLTNDISYLVTDCLKFPLALIFHYYQSEFLKWNLSLPCRFSFCSHARPTIVSMCKTARNYWSSLRHCKVIGHK